ncbi:hypothetical protein [Bradyrhizobium stylosanthis]|uniref:hypothetical protein n=1 Tax=Bradyrhizobium stylosanthis TaxID=1803665 RepID=UPI0012E92E45|nr:hypothetical protein [Bradyrhizobium stylosanthis]
MSSLREMAGLIERAMTVALPVPPGSLPLVAQTWTKMGCANALLSGVEQISDEVQR